MLKKLLPYTKGYRPWIALGIACSAMDAIFQLLIPLVMADIVDIGVANADTGFIVRKGLLMVVLAVVAMAFGLGSAASSARAGMGFGANLRTAEYARVQGFSFSNIEKFSTASLVTRLTSDVRVLEMTLMMSMRLLVRAPVMLVAALVLAVRLSSQLSRVFLGAIPLLVIFVVLLMTKVGPLFRLLQEKTDDVNLVVQENLTGIRVVKSFVREEHEKEKFSKRNNSLRETSEKAFGAVVVNMPVMMLIIYGTIIAVMWFGGKMVFAGTMEVGGLTAFFSYITEILISLMMVSMIFMMMSRSIACAKRICEVLDEVPSVTDAQAKNGVAVKSGSVDFENVSFRYNGESAGWVLEDVSLHIPAGSTVGILGGTGSGKSTLVSLIPRLYEAQKGSVLVGGRPVADYTMEHLRDAVSVVLQKNTLFSGTIRENLLWGNPDATEDQLLAACRSACADEFLDRMPEGLDTDLGQGGVNVSGGQKQRLCIARAILKQPKILILDDSTSAVDTATDAKIREAFRRDLPGTTKLIIAQRISSIADADLILVLDKGRVVAQGSHEELMKNCEIYQDVYLSQQEGVSISG
ncbi:MULTISPECIES: ABC transporter ATP-binding protein [unclassified Oscillibacter]|uniref:ABC transporter ATP-binding protein n=1 Tax=unclassified Oscillibacter TaxID=2629304 RepID=UPI0025F9AB9C|nr:MULTISPECIES: ABC transporter ATP-binding protein [unclassified Oscillibacter]